MTKLVITICIACIISIGFALKHQNDVLRYDEAAKAYNNNTSFTAYNHASFDTAKTILANWKASQTKTQAAKRLIYLDYALMALYGFLLCYGLWYQAPKQARTWFAKLIWLAFACIVFGVTADCIQDSATLYNITHADIKNTQFLTTPKWAVLYFGGAILVISLVKPLFKSKA